MILTLLLRRAIFFIAFVLVFALVAASMAHSATGERGVVAFSGFAPGTIVVRTSERSLYFVIDQQRALRFPVGVGRTGKTWTGVAQVEGKFVKPAWQAPPELGGGPVIPGGAANNPMGEAALTLRGGEYAIHGTNRPESIGRFVSAGCIRMHNRDIVELYRLVPVGTPVIVER
jgi:lipoprotein-anchoring transpeptidase ErfK/SrfK